MDLFVNHSYKMFTQEIWFSLNWISYQFGKMSISYSCSWMWVNLYTRKWINVNLNLSDVKWYNLHGLLHFYTVYSPKPERSSDNLSRVQQNGRFLEESGVLHLQTETEMYIYADWQVGRHFDTELCLKRWFYFPLHQIENTVKISIHHLLMWFHYFSSSQPCRS